MATTKRNKIVTPSWAQRTELPISPNHEPVTVSPTARFFVIKLIEGSFQNMSPFLIHKSLQSVLGELKNIKKLRSGDLMVEVNSTQQALQLSNFNFIANHPVSVSPHRTLNYSRGVISEVDLLHISETEILENLQDQQVCQVRRITSRRNGEVFPTRNLVLTFATPKLPTHIRAGYLHCTVRPYIPNPLRCFQCQRFGHSKLSCRGSPTCARCAEVGHDSDNCSNDPKCVNCKADHPSFSRSCSTWLNEKEIQVLKTKNNISYPEARKLVVSRTPITGLSYSAAVSQKSVKSIATQTDSLPTIVYHNTNQTSKQPTKPAHKMTNNSVKIQTPQITETVNNPTPKKTTRTKLPRSKKQNDVKTPLKSQKYKPLRKDVLKNRPALADDTLITYVSSEENMLSDGSSVSEARPPNTAPR